MFGRVSLSIRLNRIHIQARSWLKCQYELRPGLGVNINMSLHTFFPRFYQGVGERCATRYTDIPLSLNSGADLLAREPPHVLHLILLHLYTRQLAVRSLLRCCLESNQVSKETFYRAKETYYVLLLSDTRLEANH